MPAASDQLAPDQFLLYLHDDIRVRPTHWVTKLFDWIPWEKQQEIFESPFKHRFTCAPTGHGVGKTDLVSVLIPMWLLSHTPAFVIVNSASWPNIQARIWPSLVSKLEGMNEGPIKAMLTHKMPVGDKNSARWRLGNEWEAIGLSPNKPEVSAGWHSQGGTLVIVDEASALESEIAEALMSFVKSSNDAMLLLGNPIRSEGIFADIARRRKGTERWHVIPVSSTTTPNYIAVADAIARGEITHDEAMAGAETKYTVIPGLQTYSYCQEKIISLGMEHPVTKARVFGEVPDQGEKTFISRMAVMDCALRPGPKVTNPGCVISIDPAYSPVGDETVILVYDPTAHAIVHCEEHQGWGKEETLVRVLELDSAFNASKIVIDEIAYGHGLFEDFRDRYKMAKAVGINTARSPHDPEHFHKLRDEAWSKTRDALPGLSIPKEHITKFEELSELEYDYPHNRLKIEGKIDYKKRTRHNSPHHADALVLIFARQPGDIAFETAGNHIGIDFTPLVEPDWKYDDTGSLVGNGWTLHFREVPTTVYPKRSGVLCRAMWYSRRDKSGALWIHIDEVGCWTVFRGFQTFGATIGEFCRKVADHSEDKGIAHTYEYDVLSAPAGVEKAGRFHLNHAIQEQFIELSDERRQKEYSLPMFVPPQHISGMAGLDIIDELLQSTLARFKEDDYWANRDLNPEDFFRNEMLVVKPNEVLEELAEARLRQPGVATDRREPGPEELIGGGGPFIRCLRLLAVSGAGALV